MVRADLGPDAAVLHTREVQPGIMRWLGAARQIEVMATAESSSVPSRLSAASHTDSIADDHATAPQQRFRSQLDESATVGMNLLENAEGDFSVGAPSHVLEQLLVQQWTQELATEYLRRALTVALQQELSSERLLRSRVARVLEETLPACRPIQVGIAGRRVVALVGPTGVGKTTTIAKLAANFRIRLRKRVGLITVDTYRIAAVDQLRTYAEIIDLPMQIVSTPHEMQAAAHSMADLDLVLIDTAGQSPHDIARLQGLRAILAAAPVNETHLVLSTAGSANTLLKTVEQFQTVGVSSLILTKLDEAYGLGNVASLACAVPHPFSYLTHGQNVPDDIAPAERGRLARALVGLGCEVTHA